MNRRRVNDDWADDITDSLSPPTPGPWMVTTSWYDHMVTGPNGEEIIWQDGPYQTPTIKLADARLIAAAPEMYELIERAGEIMNELESLIDSAFTNDASAQKSQWLKDADALLAKIQGGGK